MREKNYLASICWRLAAIISLGLLGFPQIVSSAEPTTRPTNAVPTTLLPKQAATNVWLDAKLLAQANQRFTNAIALLETAVKLENNEEIDKIIDAARSELEKLAGPNIVAITSGVTNMLRGYRQEANRLTETAASGRLAEGWSDRYFALANDWRVVVSALELRLDELAAIQGDLARAIESLDTQRDYWRSAVRLDAARALETELRIFIADLRKIRDQFRETTTGGVLRPPQPRPVIGLH